MIESRADIYAELGLRIGHTPLVVYGGIVPNSNHIWIKRECDNPFGSHYDRVYLALFQHYESTGRINPGDKILETSSGTAGVSCASIAKILGYECHLAIPEGVDDAVIQAIRTEEAVLYFTPEKDYISGFPAFVREFLPHHRDIFFLNHSMGPKQGHGVAYSNNEVVLASLEGIATEVLDQFHIHYYLPAVGNGSSVVGPGRVLPPSTVVVAFESAQSAVAYNLKFPGRYQEQFGIAPGTLPKHKLRGTSFQGIDFPHIRTAVETGLIHDVILLSDAAVTANYHFATRRDDFAQLPHWDEPLPFAREYGRSTRAGIIAALEIAKKVHGKNLLVVAYDKANRYDF